MMTLARASSSAAHWSLQQYRNLFSPVDGAHRLALVAEGTAEIASNATSPSRIGVLGFLIARNVLPQWELENIVIQPESRKTGIGRKLLGALIEAARVGKGKSLILEVRDSNFAARAFYEQAGFERDGRRKSYYANPSEDAILYRLNLL